MEETQELAKLVPARGAVSNTRFGPLKLDTRLPHCQGRGFGIVER